MPLRCLDSTGQSIRAFEYSRDAWDRLVHKNRTRRHLKMPCCSAEVVMRISSRGLQFFAHKAKGDCTTATETQEHLHLKQMAVTAARACGWTADTEVDGATPSGASWKADVLAQRGKHTVAVEIQWSGQTNEETLRRQLRYNESGIRGLWLLRQPGFPVTQDLPAVCIGGSLEDGFEALIPGVLKVNAYDRNDPSRWHQTLSMKEFLVAVFDRRFQYGFPPDGEAVVSIWGTEDSCWSCGAETMLLARVEIQYGPNRPYFPLADFGEHRDLVPILLRNIPDNLGIGAITYRSSNPFGRYLCNGCAHCGAMYGHHYAVARYGEARELHHFPISLTPAWRRLIETDYGHQWSVYPRQAEPC